MPQPGDGDLWPTTDDDRPRETPSTPVNDAVTREMPVPEEPKKPSGGGWFDPPTPTEPAAGSDKSHAEPAPAATWPVAELEQQARKPDAERTVSVRTVPNWSTSAQSSEPASSNGEPTDDEPAPDAPEPEEPTETSQPADQASGSADQVSESADQVNESADQVNESADQASESADSAEPTEPAEPAEQESADQDVDSTSPAEPSNSSAEAESAETSQAGEPMAAPDEEDGDSAGSVEPESGETAQESQSSSARPEADETPQPAASTESDEQENNSSDGDSAESAGSEADGEQAATPTEEQAATAEKDQRGGDHPTVIGQVGGDGTRTGLRAVAVNKSSTPAWPDEQEDRPTGDTTVNLATPAAEPPTPSEQSESAESPEATESSKTAELPKPAEPEPAEGAASAAGPKSAEPSAAAEQSESAESPEATESSKTAELPKPAEDSRSTADTKVAEPAKAAEWPRSDESPQPAGPAASAESGKTAEWPKAPETPKATEPPKTSEPPRTAEPTKTAAPFDAFKPAEPVDRTAIVERPTVAEPPKTTESPATGRPPVGRETAQPPAANPTQDDTDSATVFFPRPVLPPKDRPQTDPPSFIRPRQEADSTAFIPRIPQPAQPDQRPERQQEWPPPEPPRAAPQRVGPQPQEPPARRKKKPLLIAAIAVVAVLGLAAGVVFGVPGLAAKLGLAGDDTVAAAPPPAPITYRPGLHGPDSEAPKPTKEGVAAALAGPISNPALGTVTGVVVDPATGETLYERDGGTAITPASTGKILTAAAALLSLDHTEQLVTKVVQGERPGEVIIVGGGDPTISSLPDGEVSMYPGAAHLDELVEKVRNSGVQVQTVYIDQSRYAGPGLAPSWLPEDVGDGYIAPIVPAMLDGDREDPTVNYSPRTTDPGRRLVNEFASRTGASPAASIEKKAPANAKVLGEIRSAPVAQLVDNMLDHSDNTLGDILAHEVAVKAGEEPSFDGAARAMLNVLRLNGFDVDGVVLRDGSGMSIQNKMSAKVLAQVLAIAAGPDGKDPRTNKLRPLLGGLPVAGGSGTLEERYGQDGAAAAGRGWVRAKTGTLSGVNSLAGIVLDQDNRPLVFAFLTEGTQQNSARPALDVVAAALRGCGCQ